jgi:GAF domain-containing protein
VAVDRRPRAPHSEAARETLPDLAPDWPTRLAEATDLPTVQTIVTRTARKMVGADGATIVFRDGEHCFYADEDSIAPLWKGQRFPIRECVSGWAMRTRLPAVVPDIWRDSRIPTEVYRPTFVRSLVMVPIGTEQPVGAVGVYWAERRFDLGHRELGSLERLCAEAARAITAIGLDDAPWAPNFRLGTVPPQRRADQTPDAGVIG